MARDPLTSIPGEAKLRLALRQLEFLVCVDLFQNATGREADLLLPTTSWLERWDIANTTALFQHTPLIQYTRPVRTAPGSSFRSPHSGSDEFGIGAALMRQSDVGAFLELACLGYQPGDLAHSVAVAGAPVVPGRLGSPCPATTARTLSGTRPTHPRTPDAVLAC